MKERLLRARKSGELSKEINVDVYARYLSSILAGLSIQAANGSTKAELKRTTQMAIKHLLPSGFDLNDDANEAGEGKEAGDEFRAQIHRALPPAPLWAPNRSAAGRR
jgi:hypothetical protein